ncbi:MFS transporter [Acrocarpospora corrugata]|uniref:MFS transporter n=1 Tax=Acrocarpospora corrugata TaxID=35763 RepID=A0A5M3W317_9ACTN|nr:MFS transporter [Acrocarpospora corrugata]GES03154.1 MFS transporter [Acrocarpospora corrugata]
MESERSPRLNDEGLEEVIDPSTRVDQVTIDPAQQAKIDSLRARRGGFWIAVVLSLVLLSEQSALAITVFAPILPQFAAEYETAQIVWILTVFALAGAVATPLLAKVGDIYGKKRALLITAAIATVGAVIGIFATSFIVLLIGRALMGAAIAFAPLTFALMRDTFPPRWRSLGISIATNGIGVVVIAGPLLASLLVDLFSTSAVFVLMAGISLVGLVLVALIVPESPLRTRGSIDYLGAVILACGVLAVQLGLTQARDWGYGDPRTLGLFLGGLVVLGVWVQQQRVTREPLINIKLLTSRPIWAPMLACGLVTSATAMGSYVVPQMLATPSEAAPAYGQGLTSTEIALVFSPAGLLVIVGGVFVGLTAKSIGFRNHVFIGAALVASHVVVLALLHTEVWHYMLGYALGGAGLLVLAARPNLILLAVPEDQRAVATGIVGTGDGILGGMMQQISYVVLAGAVAMEIAPGVNLYQESGFVTALLIGAVVSAVGGLLALAIPQGRRVVTARPVVSARP